MLLLAKHRFPQVFVRKLAAGGNSVLSFKLHSPPPAKLRSFTFLSVCYKVRTQDRRLMKISTRGRYALRFMADLAEHNEEGFIPLKDVSERQAISIKYLEQIAAGLSREGLLESVRGPQGGYKLSKDAGAYTVKEILTAAEGSLAPVACLDKKPLKCRLVKNCRTIKLWRGLAKVIDGYLDSISLADLLKDSL